MNKKIEEIKNILLNEWDPIGISEIKEAHDEYDSYAEYIYNQKINNTNMSVSKYLSEIEKYIGLNANQELNLKIEKKIDYIVSKSDM